MEHRQHGVGYYMRCLEFSVLPVLRQFALFLTARFTHAACGIDPLVVDAI